MSSKIHFDTPPAGIIVQQLLLIKQEISQSHRPTTKLSSELSESDRNEMNTYYLN